MARWHRRQRRADQTRRLQPPLERESSPGQPRWSTSPKLATQRVEVAREVPRLAYTPRQAAQALGISRSTLRRLMPYLDTIEMPWGGTLIPVDELERLAAERREAALARRPRLLPGRKPTIPPRVVERIRARRNAGKSLREIAAELNTEGVATAHGGVRWWPSTIRAVLRRAA